MWKYTGQKRPDFAEEPGPGEESVWDYPRPPRVEPDSRRIEVYAENEKIADTSRAYRVLETASPPTFYLPPQDVNRDLLIALPNRSFCEWKGEARYWALATDRDKKPIGWTTRSRPNLLKSSKVFFILSRKTCLFCRRTESAPPARKFYGGWVTDEIVGPFKGEPGASNW
jgi:uncharacterized protein (DUF427 family)